VQPDWETSRSLNPNLPAVACKEQTGGKEGVIWHECWPKGRWVRHADMAWDVLTIKTVHFVAVAWTQNVEM